MLNKFFPKKTFYILILIILFAVFSLLAYFLGYNKAKRIYQSVEGSRANPADFGAGSEGEITVKDEKTGKESYLISPTMPSIITSTSGKISEVNQDRIVLRSDGYSFADGLPRNITAVFTADTITFNKNQSVHWTGNSGLKQLKPGMNILVEGSGNIRGKIEFEAKTINMF
ncbi:MAG: hypothetical protein PHF44_01270 [Candidatus Pacebacteria bacterium]|nr:hypothetical protein [Candidatus Paceibacterota bacterium]